VGRWIWARGRRPPRAEAWYALAPSFARSIEGRAAFNAVVVDGTLVEVLNARTLLGSHCVRTREYRRGRPYMVSDCAALLACGRLDEVGRWLSASSGRRPVQRALRAILDGGDEGEARRVLEGAADDGGSGLEAAVAWAALLGETDRASRLASESALGPAGAARVRGLLLGDSAGARAHLAAVMDGSTGFDCVELAHVWMLVGGDEPRLRHFLEERGERLEPCAAAHVWWAVLSDRDRAQAGLERAGERAAGALERLALAETWAVLLEEGDRARRSLQAAEKVAAGPDEWRRTARAWSGLFGDLEAASCCLEMAEAEQQSLADRVQTARGYRELVDDEASARRSLQRFEDAAGVALDWVLAARIWEGVAGGQVEIEGWLDRAQELARSDREREAVATSRRDLLDPDRNAEP